MNVRIARRRDDSLPLKAQPDRWHGTWIVALIGWLAGRLLSMMRLRRSEWRWVAKE